VRRDVSGYTIRWDNSIAHEAQITGSWPDRTIAEYAAERVTANPDRVLVIDNAREIRTAELWEKSRRLAGYLHAQGICPGQIISFQLPNWHEANIINLAAAMVGAVVHPISPILRDAEVAYMLNDCASRIIFVPEKYRQFEYHSMVRNIAASLSRDLKIACVRGSAAAADNFDDIVAANPPLECLAKVDPNAVKLIMYTSGTTGRPKGGAAYSQHTAR